MKCLSEAEWDSVVEIILCGVQKRQPCAWAITLTTAWGGQASHGGGGEAPP